ncbi:hypothetical protein MLD38_009915 [Melastoma candidum]|uniref:Uncharacterized protein n=1 Tax=Melastoma candidum TaxID=119954 RepID=A0ACB9R1A1_9MYRT|nr:hypothetical protein MLD38_009915 [Melastoma candidum]
MVGHMKDVDIGTRREEWEMSGLPAASSRERLEVLDDEHYVISFRILGGEHRLANYTSVTALHEAKAGSIWMNPLLGRRHCRRRCQREQGGRSVAGLETAGSGVAATVGGAPEKMGPGSWLGIWKRLRFAAVGSGGRREDVTVDSWGTLARRVVTVVGDSEETRRGPEEWRTWWRFARAGLQGTQETRSSPLPYPDESLLLESAEREGGLAASLVGSGKESSSLAVSFIARIRTELPPRLLISQSEVVPWFTAPFLVRWSSSFVVVEIRGTAKDLRT